MYVFDAGPRAPLVLSTKAVNSYEESSSIGDKVIAVSLRHNVVEFVRFTDTFETDVKLKVAQY